ncbi:MAG TPA: response regulator transcription factor [Actinoplanes sp.]|nr:response regulator transcription factor [Actinoplanes sp.]
MPSELTTREQRHLSPSIHVDVLIAHPEPAARSGLRCHLHDERIGIRVAGTVGGSAETLTEAARLRPAVVLIDERLTTPDHLATLAAESRVILLTAETDPRAIGALLVGPARGYLVYDNFETADLRNAVLAVAAGLAWLSPLAAAAATAGMRATGRHHRPHHTTNQALRFTGRERDVLELLCRGLTNAAIADTLAVTEKTVKNHLNRSFAKLGVHSRTEAVNRLTDGQAARARISRTARSA